MICRCLVHINLTSSINTLSRTGFLKNVYSVPSTLLGVGCSDIKDRAITLPFSSSSYNRKKKKTPQKFLNENVIFFFLNFMRRSVQTFFLTSEILVFVCSTTKVFIISGDRNIVGLRPRNKLTELITPAILYRLETWTQ